MMRPKRASDSIASFNVAALRLMDSTSAHVPLGTAREGVRPRGADSHPAGARAEAARARARRLLRHAPERPPGRALPALPGSALKGTCSSRAASPRLQTSARVIDTAPTGFTPHRALHSKRWFF